MKQLQKVAVFCGSSTGTDEIFASTAYSLGRILASEEIGVIYGGAKIGLMGKVADGALDHGGEVIGVLPHFLRSKEVAHTYLNQLILVDTMHERKTKIHELADGFIALPGGLGTMEELFEILTWAQLGLHGKPIGLLNPAGFYDSLLVLTQTMIKQGFLKAPGSNMLLVHDDIRGLLHEMKYYRAPVVPRWITPNQT